MVKTAALCGTRSAQHGRADVREQEELVSLGPKNQRTSKSKAGRRISESEVKEPVSLGPKNQSGANESVSLRPKNQ